MCWQDDKEPSGQNLNEEVPLRSKESGETTAPFGVQKPLASSAVGSLWGRRASLDPSTLGRP